jgi:hypothetical protein
VTEAQVCAWKIKKYFGPFWRKTRGAQIGAWPDLEIIQTLIREFIWLHLVGSRADVAT